MTSPAKRRRLDSLANLCAECSLLNLRKAFTEADEVFTKDWGLILGLREWRDRRVEFDGIRVAALGNRISRDGKSDCSLCHFFFDIRLGDNEANGYELRAYPSYWVIPFIKVNPTVVRAADRKFQPSVLVVVPLEWDNATIQKSFDVSKCIFRYSNPKIGAIRPYKMEPLVDFDRLKSWIDFCTCHHALSCLKAPGASRKGPKIPGFSLIDCQKRKVIKSSLSRNYVALSYVWGSVTSGQEAAWPQVVEDTIITTLRLGFEYLWVDRYCIDQKNAQEKHDQVANMDRIYQTAQLTIIAAAGRDASHGLAGVSQTRSVPPHFSLNGLEIGAVPEDALKSIEASTWWSRGWTYQEGVLSRRCAVFAESQVYYQCESMVCYESFEMLLRELHLPSLLKSRPFVRAGIFSGHQAEREQSFRPPQYHKSQPSPEWLLYHIRNYSHRSLTYDTDVLQAFLGILNINRERTFYGLLNTGTRPKLDFDLDDDPYGLPNIGTRSEEGHVESASGDRRSVIFDEIDTSSWHLRTMLVSWWHANFVPNPIVHGEALDDPGPRRVHLFPSWSWLGWRGKVENQAGLEELDWGPREAPVTLWLEDKPLLDRKPKVLQDVRDFSTVFEPMITISQRTQRLRVLSLETIGQEQPDSNHFSANAVVKTNGYPQQQSTATTVLHFKLSISTKIEELGRVVKEDEVEILLMSISRAKRDYYFLVIRKIEGSSRWERIGICHGDYYSASMLSEVGKSILLF